MFYGKLKEGFQKRRGHGEHLSSAEFFSASIIAGESVLGAAPGRELSRVSCVDPGMDGMLITSRFADRRLHESNLGGQNTNAGARSKPPGGL